MKVTEKNNCLYVEEAYYKDGEAFVRFPEGMFANREDEQSMLAWSSCKEAMFRMRRILSLALKGKASRFASRSRCC